MSGQGEPVETFTERFVRLTTTEAKMKPAEIGALLGVGEHAVRKLLAGETQDLKLRPALRLAARLGVSPWYLACEREPGNAAAILFDRQEIDKVLHDLRKDLNEVREAVLQQPSHHVEVVRKDDRPRQARAQSYLESTVENHGEGS